MVHKEKDAFTLLKAKLPPNSLADSVGNSYSNIGVSNTFMMPIYIVLKLPIVVLHPSSTAVDCVLALFSNELCSSFVALKPWYSWT